MKTIGTSSQAIPHGQRGTALVMALVVLLLLTIIGVSAMNTTQMQERMSGNLKDKTLAFEAAETALIHAETWLAANVSSSVVTGPAVAANGFYASGGCSTGNTYKPIWECVDWNGPNVIRFPGVPGGSAGGQNLLGVSAQPRYIFEQLALGPAGPGQRRVVRITARGVGGTSQAIAMVQTVVDIPAN